MKKLTTKGIRAKFRKFFNGQNNFMSPHPIDYGQVADLIWELSHGLGMFGQQCFGITVLQRTSNPARVKRPDISGLSKCCFSENEAREYIRKLDSRRAYSSAKELND